MNDVLLAGTQEVLLRWPEFAAKRGILRCEGNEGRSCSWENGCGIGDDLIRFNLIPITSVDDYDLAEFETVLLVTPSKKSSAASEADSRFLIRDFLLSLQKEGVMVLDSKTSVGGQRTWLEYR